MRELTAIGKSLSWFPILYQLKTNFFFPECDAEDLLLLHVLNYLGILALSDGQFSSHVQSGIKSNWFLGFQFMPVT